jgi:hypothetical protein
VTIAELTPGRQPLRVMTLAIDICQDVATDELLDRNLNSFVWLEEFVSLSFVIVRITSRDDHLYIVSAQKNPPSDDTHTLTAPATTMSSRLQGRDALSSF